VLAVQEANPDLDLAWPKRGDPGERLLRSGFRRAPARSPSGFLRRFALALHDDVAWLRRQAGDGVDDTGAADI
jgi:hypothetical protein